MNKAFFSIRKRLSEDKNSCINCDDYLICPLAVSNGNWVCDKWNKIKLKSMINDKKIEEAIENYVRYSSVEDEYPGTEGNAFKAGAEWAINEFLKNLWHPNTEEPDKSKGDVITLGFDNSAYLQFKESILWNKESWRHSVSRCQIGKWAYLFDILPK